MRATRAQVFAVSGLQNRNNPPVHRDAAEPEPGPSMAEICYALLRPNSKGSTDAAEERITSAMAVWVTHTQDSQPGTGCQAAWRIRLT